MRDGNGQQLRFAAFELDPANELLRKGGVVVKLPPQPLQSAHHVGEPSGRIG